MSRNRNVGHEQVVKMLENGADAKAKSREGRASSLAKKKGYTEIVELLRKHVAKE